MNHLDLNPRPLSHKDKASDFDALTNSATTDSDSLVNLREIFLCTKQFFDNIKSTLSFLLYKIIKQKSGN